MENVQMEQYMRRCLELARMGECYVAPNPMVGAVLVSADGSGLAEGYHERFGEGHAEVNCFKEFDRRITEKPAFSSLSLKDATLFVSLEPCSHYGKTPPCADLIIKRGVGHVVVGCLDPNSQVSGKGVEKLRAAGVEITEGVLEDECRLLNKRFMMLHEQGRPYVVLKWAQSADGYLGREGERTVFSTPLTKQLVHKMRAENMAILVGSNTALVDNPKLLNTHWAGRNPIRILLDRRGRVPKDYNIFSSAAETIVYSEDTEWKHVLQDLASRGIHSVLVEGGANVLKSVLESGLYDEVHVEVNPRVVLGGGVKAPVLPLPVVKPAEMDGNLLYTIYHTV